MAYTQGMAYDPTKATVQGVTQPAQPKAEPQSYSGFTEKPKEMSDDQWTRWKTAATTAPQMPTKQQYAASIGRRLDQIPAGVLANFRDDPNAPAAAAAPAAATQSVAAAPAPTGMAPAAASAQPGQPGLANIGIDTAEDDSIAGRLAALTAQNSPVVQQARAQGMRAANTRGLLNSSIAVGAAQDSVYKVAAPLAAQEAAQVAARNQSRVQIAGQLAQITKQAGFDKEARADQFGYQTKLNEQQFGYTKELNSTQYAEERKRLELQLANATAQQKTEIEARLTLLDKEFGNQSKLSTQNYGQQSQLQAQNIGAQMAQLEKQLASAEGQQKVAIAADLQKLQVAQTFNTEMAKLQQGYAVDNAKLQASLQSALQAQGNTEQMQRMTAEFVNQQKVIAQQGEQALAQIAATGDQEMKRQAETIKASMAELTLRLNQQNTEAAASAAMQLFNAEAQIRAAIMANTSMPAGERQSYMNAVGTLTGPTRLYINQLLGLSPASGAPGGMAPGSQPGGVTVDGQSIYYAPSGGGYAIGGMNPYPQQASR